MARSYLSTSQIARAVGVHPNTVRLYEAWGFLATAPRSPSGYRRFSPAHLEQMRLARLAMRFTWLGGEVRRTARTLIFQGARDDLGGALESAYHLQVLIETERTQAEAAAQYLERWAQGRAADATQQELHIGQAARLLEVSADRLRNWERNGLIRVPRRPRNGYRLYGAGQIGRLRVIRTLCSARYSLMAILRMLQGLDQGESQDLRQALDTPRPDEDVLYVTDRWLTTLAELQDSCKQLVALIEEIIQARRS
ncbi:MAG: MerR family transcriptional regulator [Chloroflexota bacterium]